MTESKNRLISDSVITELALVQLRSMPEEKAAEILDTRLRVLEEAYKHSFVEAGLICVEVQERQLWRWLAKWDGTQYHSFEDWLCTAAPHSRRHCFSAMGAVKELKEIPVKSLEQMPQCNIALLRQLSSGLRSQREVIEAAQALPEREFREKIRDSFPEQHIEGKRRLTLNLDAGDYERACRILDIVGNVVDVHDREGEFMALVIELGIGA